MNTLLKKTLAIFVSIILLTSIATPSFANETSEQDELMSALLLQIQALTKEVERLQIRDYERRTGESYKTLTSEELDESIMGAIEWLLQAQEDNGHFLYEYAPYDNEYLQKDNIVRQAGTFYALSEVARRDVNRLYDLQEELKKSLEYFDERTIEGAYNGYTFACVVSTPGSKSCTMGATSLVLTGLLGFLEAYPEEKAQYSKRVSQYVDYILAMKKDGTGFRDYYYAGSDIQNDQESSFSNGEALLALARYYKAYPQSDVRAVIDETFSYISQSTEMFDFGLYLWAMAAIKDLHAIEPKEEYVSYVRAYTDWRLFGFERRKGSTHNMCAYTEGIVSAYSVLESSSTQEERERYLENIDYWLAHDVRLQITEDDSTRLVFDEGGMSIKTIADMSKARGGFLTDDYELTQRIDFTQHCLSSLMQRHIDVGGGVLK